MAQQFDAEMPSVSEISCDKNSFSCCIDQKVADPPERPKRMLRLRAMLVGLLTWCSEHAASILGTSFTQ
jgi:hypothetical protein